MITLDWNSTLKQFSKSKAENEGPQGCRYRMFPRKSDQIFHGARFSRQRDSR